MGEIVNLRRERKRLAAARAAEVAAENRVRHGRTAAQKVNDRADEVRRAGLLDGARLVASVPPADDPA
jgi:hypothetical protein